MSAAAAEQGALSGAPAGSVRSQRFSTNYRHSDPAAGMLTGDKRPVDLAESLGAKVIGGAQ